MKILLLLIPTLLAGQVLPFPGIGTATTNGGRFNQLIISTNTFTPTHSNLPAIPQTTISTTTYDETGYQDGVVANGKMIYGFYQVLPVAGSWLDAISAGQYHGVVCAYNTAMGLAGFSNAANWACQDLNNLSGLTWYSKGTGQSGNSPCSKPAGNVYTPPGNPNCYNVIGGSVGSTLVGNVLYTTPSARDPFPVFLASDTTKAVTDPTAYQTFVPPPMGGALGATYGWTTSVADAQGYLYYAPLSTPVQGISGNVFRYNTNCTPFNNPTGGVPACWSHFDMRVSVNALAKGFLGSAYDGVRYVYYIPFSQNLIVRYDTWNGGTGPDPSGFTVASNYTTFDPTQLGQPGYPTVTGVGSAANLTGLGGGNVIWDAAGQNEYLYFMPWATFPGSNPVLQSTVARVRIATNFGQIAPVDITCTACVTTYPNWEIMDISTLSSNPAWTGPATYTSGPFLGQSLVAGFQLCHAITGADPRMLFGSDVSQYLVEHDVQHHLYDPTGWWLAALPGGYPRGNFGGGFLPTGGTSGIWFPSSPGNPTTLYAISVN